MHTIVLVDEAREVMASLPCFREGFDVDVSSRNESRAGGKKERFCIQKITSILLAT